MPSTWLSGSGGRHRSCITRIMERSTPRSPSEDGVGKPACAPRWDPSATATTTLCARATLRRSSANCSTAASLRPRPKLGWPSSSSSKGSTTRVADTRLLDTSHPSTTKGGWKRPPEEPTYAEGERGSAPHPAGAFGPSTSPTDSSRKLSTETGQLQRQIGIGHVLFAPGYI